MSKPVKAAVFGTGSWGTAFAMVLFQVNGKLISFMQL